MSLARSRWPKRNLRRAVALAGISSKPGSGHNNYVRFLRDTRRARYRGKRFLQGLRLLSHALREGIGSSLYSLEAISSLQTGAGATSCTSDDERRLWRASPTGGTVSARHGDPTGHRGDRCGGAHRGARLAHQLALQ